MAVPKTTQTRYMDGSVQRTTQVTPSLHLFFLIERVSKLSCEITGNIFVQKTKMKKRCRDGVTCVVLCKLPSIYLVCVVFGTAIPTSFYIFGKCFSYFIYVFHFTQDGTTPLFMASQKGNLDVVEILLAAGAKVDLAKDIGLDSLEHTCNL